VGVGEGISVGVLVGRAVRVRVGVDGWLAAFCVKAAPEV